MKHLCFATSTNSKGKHDGDYFVAEANKYASYYRSLGDAVEICLVPAKEKTYLDRRTQVIQATERHPDADRFAFFCHGSSKYLYGAGLNIWTAGTWVRAIVKSDVRIALYACSNANWIRSSAPGSAPRRYAGDFDPAKNDDMRGEYGFAMRLAYALHQEGKAYTVFAHSTRGDTTRNPYCKLVYTDRQYIRREWIVEPVSRLAGLFNSAGRKNWLAWVRRLRNDPTYRFVVPFL